MLDVKPYAGLCANMDNRASGLEFAALLPPARRRSLCREVDCSIVVKEYAERQKNPRGPPPTKGLPAPRS